MLNFSIMPLQEKFFNETLEDIRSQYRDNVASVPLFIFQLHPEGNPIWDKVSKPCSIYAKYKKELDKDGIKSGILVQSSLGHDRALTPAPFQRYVGVMTKQLHGNYCPTDENLLKYFENVFEQLALEHPDYIMLDDDFRLVHHPDYGCCCPNHLKEFNKRTGLNLTLENFYEVVSKDSKLEKIFFEMQRDTLVYAAKRLRQAIDKIDPTIQGMTCTSGDYCESGYEVNNAFAGKGNIKIARMANGNYAPETFRLFSAYAMRLPAVRVKKLKNKGIDIVLAETDTCPHNRYAKSARYLHAHFASSILLGAKGSKHWITRTTAYEPNSGAEFRKILSKHSKLYDKLESLAEQIKWLGCGITFKEQDLPSFNKRLGNEWNNLVLERMGLPFYFTEENRGVAFMEYDIVKDLTDEEIEEFFENGSVLVDYEAATDLIKRGFKEKLGVEISEWKEDEEKPTYEWFEEVQGTTQSQIQCKKLTIINERTEVLSYNVTMMENDMKILAPAVTCLENNGNLAIVYSGTPNAPSTRQGFAFLNEIRKNQFISLMKRAKVLPVYYDGDNEICLTAGNLNDGSLIVFAVNLGFDPSDDLTLYLEKQPKEIKLFLPDGTLSRVNFKYLSNEIYSIEAKVEPMYPVILIIK